MKCSHQTFNMQFLAAVKSALGSSDKPYNRYYTIDTTISHIQTETLRTGRHTPPQKNPSSPTLNVHGQTFFIAILRSVLEDAFLNQILLPLKISVHSLIMLHLA